MFFYAITGLTSSTGYVTNVTAFTGNPVFIPCIINNYTLDGIDNFKPSAISMTWSGRSGTANSIQARYTIGGNSYWIMRPQSTGSIGQLNGPSRMCVSDSEITGGAATALGYYLTSLQAATISGRYRFKASVSNPINTILNGATCPVSYRIGNTRYRYVVFPGGGAYNSVLSPSGATRYSVAGFYTVPAFGNVPVDYELFTQSASSGAVKDAYAGEIIDFGDTPQTVPVYVKQFFDANFDFVYPYTYTIKNKTGDVLDQITECPAMQSVTVTKTGDIVTVTLTGTNSQTYTLTFTISVPEHYAFLGLSTSPTSRRAEYATGQTTPVTWDSDMTLYPIIAKYYPPVTTFSMNTYHNNSDNNVVSKSLVSVSTITGVLREGSSIMDPVVTVEQEAIPTFNYVRIPAFNNRYYFVTDITSIAYGLWKLTLHTDVLMTYASGIRRLTAVIDRQENDYNSMLTDSMIPLDNDTTQSFVEVGNIGPFSQNLDVNTAKNIIITIVRGDVS